MVKIVNPEKISSKENSDSIDRNFCQGSLTGKILTYIAGRQINLTRYVITIITHSTPEYQEYFLKQAVIPKGLYSDDR